MGCLGRETQSLPIEAGSVFRGLRLIDALRP